MTKKKDIEAIPMSFDLERKTRLARGAEDEARTRYLHLGKVALYQMSYSRTTEIIIATIGENVKPSLGKN